MIIKFEIENWRSFRDTSTLSMIASLEKQHGLRLPRIKKYQMRILPVAGIYGGNASGKTNLFKALNFSKRFIVKGSQPDSLINVEPFKVSKAQLGLPTRFLFELLIDEIIYEYSFLVTSREVIEEKLVKISSSNEKVLYSRNNNKYDWCNTLEKDKHIKYASIGTRDNQLFLTNTIQQKIDTFMPIYDWFKNGLVLIAPDWRYWIIGDYIDKANPACEFMNEMLNSLDSGIMHLAGESINADMLTQGIKNAIDNKMQMGESSFSLRTESGDGIVISSDKGKIVAKKIVSYHKNAQGEEIKFDLDQESDGTLRLIDLLPAFMALSIQKQHHVFVIDELDRSLHTILTRKLIEEYLGACNPDSRSQLMFTTHDVLLMDQDLLRRDEMWVTERQKDGNSTLFSFSDYKNIRSDKDIRKYYLQGRLGGVPNILLSTDHC